MERENGEITPEEWRPSGEPLGYVNFDETSCSLAAHRFSSTYLLVVAYACIGNGKGQSKGELLS